MPYENNYIEKLLGIKGVILKNIEKNNDSIIISFKLEVKEHICPCCEHITTRIHDYKIQTIKKVPVIGKHTYFRYYKGRYVCNSYHKMFYEDSKFVPRYHRMTSRLVSYIVTKLRNIYSITSIAKECNVSVSTVTRVFNYSFKNLSSVFYLLMSLKEMLVIININSH